LFWFSAVRPVPNPHFEITLPNPAPGRLKFAVFDFDGTLSLVRAGWQQIMSDLMVDVLQETPFAGPERELRTRAEKPIHELAGQPTVVQMQWLADEVRARGGTALSAEAYKREYLERLHTQRPGLADLRAGRLRPEQLRVSGSLEFVIELRRRDVTCYIASGTDEPAVCAEAAALGFTPYLAEIRGARGDGQDPKVALIDRLTRERGLSPGELAAFGDGRVELEYARAAGGLAIGVAYNETAEGGLSTRKRGLLIAAGAEVVVADFQQPEHLLAYLWPNES
jgi:phosphoglycolate phosphatase